MRQYLRILFILTGALVLVYLLNEYNQRLEVEVSEEVTEEFQQQDAQQVAAQQQAAAQQQVQVLPGPSSGFGDNHAEIPGATQQVQTTRTLPADCFPKDQLKPSELLPGDANSKWAQVNPMGQGELKDVNFLEAGYHVGVNTVGQSLRNANRQLRSEPLNPQVKVSPWNQTTIEPDVNRRPLEIGSGN